MQKNRFCERWKKHRETGKKSDSCKCYQILENDIAFIQKNGIAEFEKVQKVREEFLKKMLQEFDEGRSKSYYCIAVTVLDVDELKKSMTRAEKDSGDLETREKFRLLHGLLGEVTTKKGYYLNLRRLSKKRKTACDERGGS